MTSTSGGVATMLCFTAGAIRPACLEKRPLKAICGDYVKGFCRHGDSCHKSHEICTLLETSNNSNSRKISAARGSNILSLTPRIFPYGRPRFDTDGPGKFAVAGPRHDNDHENIRDIRVLPTTDEILSLQPPYMPSRDAHAHHLPRGHLRLLDTLFRQLRYEHTESIIDVCYHAAQQLATRAGIRNQQDYSIQCDTPRGVRYCAFRDIQFEEVLFHDRKGLVIRVSFACPEALRGSRAMHFSGHFEDGMLVALIGLNNEDKSISSTFFEVHLRQSTDAMKPRTGNNLRASVQLSLANREDMDGMRNILYHAQGLCAAQFVLVEFPGVLFAGFSWCLGQLQSLCDTEHFAFSSKIALTDTTLRIDNDPPSYASSNEFSYNLGSLRKDPELVKGPLDFRPSEFLQSQQHRDRYLSSILSATTLDEGQAVALCENLSRGLAFTQGPPGTGKTYLGVALAKAILGSRPKSAPKPILAVALTNHALDSFLSGLLNAGVTRLVRLGMGSKEDWTKEYQLRILSQKLKLTGIERHGIQEASLQVEGLIKEGSSLCQSIGSDSLSWHAIRSHLQAHYQKIFNHFVSIEAIGNRPADVRLARLAGGFVFEYWCKGGDLADIDSLLNLFDTMLGPMTLYHDSDEKDRARERVIVTISQNTKRVDTVINGQDIWKLPLSERKTMMKQWKSEINPWSLLDETAEIHSRHQAALRAKMGARNMVNRRCLEQQDVVGLTTTACAHYWPLLNSVGFKTVICEEAGEVMEPHTLCTLFSSVEHAIFIGDPLQLRPQVKEPVLSIETTEGAAYRLDESLFERMMLPSNPEAPRTLTSQLNIQRRMHPDIADLSRITYPYLKDHESTKAHSPVAGMADRVYWLNHTQPEDRMDPRSPMSKSFSNAYEVEMIHGFVHYLVNSNEYDMGQIAVLTPYNGQLAALFRRLSAICSIWLSEKDRETLTDEGLLTPEEVIKNRKTDVPLTSLLRIATVDNFQGEEARVVILSTVRSNSEDRVGFLKTPNRINVACSRARDGCYIIGNAGLMRKVPLWNSILENLISKDKVGPAFRACCTRHPQQEYLISSPGHFLEIPRCQHPCDVVLNCGHLCQELCHATPLHERMSCKAPCSKQLEACKHRCQRACGEPCGRCLEKVSTASLPCSHNTSVICSEQEEGLEIVCKEVIGIITLPCGHEQAELCSSSGNNVPCEEQCGLVLGCGHQCTEACKFCGRGGHHPQCKALCGNRLSCGHTCMAKCHEDNCPPCQQPCQRSCTHGVCRKVCSKICDPCVQPCQCECDHHQSCGSFCSLPCARVPCKEPCTKVLPCGHICPSLCGERCPVVCAQCITGCLPQQFQIALTCGHSFDLATLDLAFGLAYMFQVREDGAIEQPNITKSSIQAPLCPQCQTPCKDVARYALYAQLQSLPDTTDRMYAMFGRKMNIFQKDIFSIGEELILSYENFSKKFKPGPLAGKTNQRLAWERGNAVTEVQEQITKFRDKVVLPYESAISRLVSYIRNPNILALHTLPFRLRLDLLYYRCRLITLEESLKITTTLTSLQPPSQHVEALAEGLRVMTIEQGRHNVKALETLIAESEARYFIRLEVELRMVQISFHMLLRKYNFTSELDIEACMKKALNLCYRYPTTAGILLQSARILQARIEGRGASRRLFTYDAMAIWREWGYHTIGHLTYCSNGHPFSTANFSDCPECGPSIELPVKPEVDYNSFLQEDAFLRRLQEARQVSVQRDSALSSDEEKRTGRQPQTASHSSTSSSSERIGSTSVSSNGGSGLPPAPASNNSSNASISAAISRSPSANWISPHLQEPMPCLEVVNGSQPEKVAQDNGLSIAPHLRSPTLRSEDSKGPENEAGTEDKKAWTAPHVQPPPPQSKDSKGFQNEMGTQDSEVWIPPHLRRIRQLDRR